VGVGFALSLLDHCCIIRLLAKNLDLPEIVGENRSIYNHARSHGLSESAY
jgi:hypothetical protein